MKVALVHDFLIEFGGAERVLVEIKKIFPEADVYTAYFDKERLGIHAEEFKDWNIITSWADKIPLFRKLHSPLRFLYPLIWESFDFSQYDLVISSSNNLSKGIITKPTTKHISYIHHPPRYLYYYETAVEWQKYFPIRVYGHLINHSLRMADYLFAQRPDYLLANSEETKKRIKKFYRRDSEVVYPPITIPKMIAEYKNYDKKYYITLSRLAKAKHVDVLIKAANTYKFQLKVVGSGRDSEYLKSLAGDTVEFLGSVSDEILSSLFKDATAFLFASRDDEFGMAPIEAMAHGLPVIAYASGGLKETIKNGQNGYLYEDLDEKAVGEEIKKIESLSDEKYLEMRKKARILAEQYSVESFKKKILTFIQTNSM
jgi:glycosyltransferase involved in cell wall biosynthesis